MFWLLLSLLVIVGGILVMRRTASYEVRDDEPWRRSLVSDDEPLDMDEARRAEDEWLESTSWEDVQDDESWR